MNEIDELTCKFCYESVYCTDKINCTKCNCKGTMSNVHDKCILEFIKHQQQKQSNLICSVCNTKYKLSRYLEITYFLDNYITDEKIKEMNNVQQELPNRQNLHSYIFCTILDCIIYISIFLMIKLLQCGYENVIIKVLLNYIETFFLISFLYWKTIIGLNIDDIGIFSYVSIFKLLKFINQDKIDYVPYIVYTTKIIIRIILFYIFHDVKIHMYYFINENT